MNKKDCVLSIIINAHHEGLVAHKTMKSVERAVKKIEEASISYEVIVSIDRGDDQTIDYFNNYTGLPIHCLLYTSRRDKYTKDFIEQKPDYVITLNPSYFVYEEWLWSRHWQFYKELLNNYTVIATNDSHVLWKRQSDNANQKTTIHPERRVQKSSSGDYIINAGTGNNIRVFEISVRYKAKSILPMTSKLPRYLLEISGSSLQEYPISLPPYSTSWSFPIALGPNDSSVRISPKAYSLIPGVADFVTVAGHHHRDDVFADVLNMPMA